MFFLSLLKDNHSIYLLILNVIGFSVATSEEIYHWKREDEKIHFSDQSPKSGGSKLIKLKLMDYYQKRNTLKNLRYKIGEIDQIYDKLARQWQRFLEQYMQ